MQITTNAVSSFAFKATTVQGKIECHASAPHPGIIISLSSHVIFLGRSSINLEAQYVEIISGPAHARAAPRKSFSFLWPNSQSKRIHFGLDISQWSCRYLSSSRFGAGETETNKPDRSVLPLSNSWRRIQLVKFLRTCHSQLTGLRWLQVNYAILLLSSALNAQQAKCTGSRFNSSSFDFIYILISLLWLLFFFSFDDITVFLLLLLLIIFRSLNKAMNQALSSMQLWRNMVHMQHVPPRLL